ncbi:CDP-glycerol glycerophosphotransferase family protein [Shewanella electrodiphila]|uniref:CDP-glycerol glycerophosphotransferase family protein n=1 Tax=Shewanella electrodiphila TaxID=934143 RepID=A0ABT0KJW8_9GAMM|nr:CDP-glycerol glycerophosphotransferase family protein [Shewanella electrodiphila]MCL1044130.1 CDP-glycerol glycerophosphotransferase family protein [Shewanella electrodiphila]
MITICLNFLISSYIALFVVALTNNFIASIIVFLCIFILITVFLKFNKNKLRNLIKDFINFRKKPKAKLKIKNSTVNGLVNAKGVADNLSNLPDGTVHLDFCFYFDAPKGSEYQLLMWLPYFSEVSDKYVVITRSKDTYNILWSKQLPVIYLPTIKDLGYIKKLDVQHIFYVNNGMKNTHMIRYKEYTHVQLLHGESDKSSSFNPISVMYDKLFVAGSIAIQRYKENNVRIFDEAFCIVGRPQVDDVVIQEIDSTSNSKKTVFYATTWSGFHADSNYTSLDAASNVIKFLINTGHNVIFRAHPYSYSNKHDAALINDIYKIIEESNKEFGMNSCISNDPRFDFVHPEMSDCINNSDIMISDVSSVIADWIASAKPFSVISQESDLDVFYKENLLARQAFILNFEDLIKDGFEVFVQEFLNKADSKDLYHDMVELRRKALGVSINESPKKFFIEKLRSELNIKN